MNIKNFALTGLLFSAVVAANAQQKLSDGTGDNGLTVNQNAILELASKNKGLLHTRVTLETTAKAYPMSAHVAGLMVYNTETRNDVVPGIYYNDGTKWVLASGGKATSISYNPTTYEISFVDATGTPVTIDFKEVVKKNETITTLVSLGEGQYKYTSENGTVTVINVPADVINNFETIVKEENVKNEIVNLIKNIGGNVYYDGAKFTYVTNTGETKEITIKEIVQANETLTVLSYNQVTNALTYKDEKGNEEIINLNIGAIVYDPKTNTITYVDGKGGTTPLTLNETSLIYDQTTKVLTYTDSKGVSHEIDLGALVAAHETVTTITEDKGVYTYINEKNEKFEINVPKSIVNNFETIVKDGPVTVNGDTFSTIEEYITHLANNVSNVSGSDFITVSGTGTVADPYKVSIKEGLPSTMLVTNAAGELEWATIESIVKGNETVTTLKNNADGTYTYTSEDNTVTVIDIPASVVENFETIVNKGPVTINGDTFNTIEDYITHLANNVSNVSGSDFISVSGTGTAADPYKVSIKEGLPNTMLVTNGAGELEWATIENIVKGNETLTVLSYDGATNVLTYVDEDKQTKTITLSVGSVSYDKDANTITYTDAAGKSTVLTFNETSLTYNPTTQELVYVNSKGETETINLGDLVAANETLTVLSYDGATNVLTYVDEDKQTKTITLSVGSVSYDKDANTITYTDAAGKSTVLTFNETSLTYNPTTQELVYVNSKGETETINLGDLVAANETLTVLSYDGATNVLTYVDEDKQTKTITLSVGSVSYDKDANTITYTDAAGKSTVLTFNETSLTYNPTTQELVYVNSKGETETINLGDLVAANETLTVLSYDGATNVLTYVDEDKQTKTITLSVGSVSYDKDANTITYTDAAGKSTVLTLNETSLTYNPTTQELVYVNSKGETETINLGDLVAANETLTVLSYDGATNVLTYVDEDKQTKTITLSVGSVSYDKDANTITYTDAAGKSTVLTLNETSLTYNPTTQELVYVNSKGETETINLGDLVAANETLTVLSYDGATNVLTYVDEDKQTKTITLSVGSVSYDKDANTITYTDAAGKSTVLTFNETSLTYNPTTQELVYVNSKGETETINLGDLVAANETLTVLSYDGATNVLTYVDEDKQTKTITLSVGSVSYDKDANTITYTDAAGKSTVLTFNETSLTYNPTTQELVYVNSKGETETINLGDLVAANETLTVLSYDGATNVLTYVDEDKQTKTITLSVGSVSYDKDANTITYTDAAGKSTVLTLNETSLTYNPTTQELVYVNSKGETETINLGDLVAANETLTVLSYDGATNVLTYVDEDKQTKTITLSVGSVSYDKDANTITYTDAAGKSTVLTLNETSLTYNPTTQELVYVNSKGETETINLGDLVAANETLTVLSYDGATNVLTYVDEDKQTKTITLSVGSVSYDKDANTITYTDAAGKSTVLTLNETSLTYNPTTQELVYVNSKGETETINLGDLVAANTTNKLTKKENTNGNTVISEVNGVKAEITLVDNVSNSLDGDNKLITTVNGKAGEGVDLTPAIQAGQKKVTLVDGTNTTVNSNVVGNNTEYRVNVSGIDAENVNNAKNLTTDGIIVVGESTSSETSAASTLLAAAKLSVKNESITTTQIQNGTIKTEDIAVANKDQVLVTDASGNPTWVDQSTIITKVTANNGLTKAVNNIKLGGELSEKTTITTTSANTLAIAGLQKGDVKTDSYVVMDASSGVLKQLKAAMPKFFYMPSVEIPTHNTGTGAVLKNQTIELYTLYTQQYGGTYAGNATTAAGQARSNGSSQLPTLPVGELDYFVTYFDQAVFENVTVNANGQLKYSVKNDAIVTPKTFMNIVFKVKD